MVVVHQERVEVVGRQLLEKFGIVLELLLLQRGFDGEKARGDLAGAAHGGSLFKDEDLGARFGCGKRGGRAGSTGANDDDVGGHGFGRADLLGDLDVILLGITARLLDGGDDGLADGFARDGGAGHGVNGRALVLDHCGGHGLGGLATEERRFARNVKLDVGEAAFGVKRHVSSRSSSIYPANTGSTAVGAYRSTTTPSTSTDAA